MTIDEAVKHAEEKAEDLESTYTLWKRLADEKDLSVPSDYEPCKKCAEEHRQLAEWLKGLKRYKEAEARPQGGWIFDEYTRKEDKKYAPNGFYLCSVCCNKQFEKSNYCPNCGADMRGERR